MYVEEFQKLTARINGITEKGLIFLFIEGLLDPRGFGSNVSPKCNQQSQDLRAIFEL